MGCIGWIVFGALAGWVASLLTGDDRRGCIGNIVLGVVGAFIGGLIVRLITGNYTQFGWDWASFGTAVLGAIVLLAITSTVRRRR